MDIHPKIQEDCLRSISVNAETTADEARRIIDEDIRNHEAAILALKSRRNTLEPISQLPPEVFCRIFALVRQILEAQEIFVYSYDYIKKKQLSVLRWIRVTHVCRHWRSIAINTPTLWTEPPLTLPNWAAVMLRRSQMAGLTLVIDAQATALDTMSASLQHIQHVKTLSIQKAGYNALRAMFTGLPEKAPQLEALCINYTSPQTVSYREAEDAQFKVPQTVFHGASRLRSLQLSYIDIELNSHLLSDLTELALCNISLDARPTWTQFMDALERMPRLESLHLQRAFPINDMSHGKTIQFAHLRHLDIDSLALEVESFFHHVTFPPLKRINVDGHINQNSSADYSGVISALSRSCSTENLGVNVHCLHVSYYMSKFHGIRLEAFNDIAQSTASQGAQADLGLLFGPTTDFGHEHVNDKIITDVFSHLNFINLTELYLGDQLHLGSDALASAFGPLPQIRLVILSDSIAKAFINALQVVSETRNNPRIPFPGLLSVTMEDVSFNPNEMADLQLEELQDCLMNRYEYGAEIRELHLHSCIRLSEEDVSLLEEIVVDVDWDGDEIGFNSTDDEDEDDYGTYSDDNIYDDDDDDGVFPYDYF